MCIIRLENITFGYDDGEPVLENFSLSIARGSCLLVRGANGAGKTTLFRILNGLEFPESGRYLYDGTAINADYLKDNSRSKRFHKRVGYLFQNPDVMLFCGSVYEEIAFGPRQMGLDDRQVDECVCDCMQLLGIEAIRDKAPYHLSGGQKKLTALAAVLALNPETVILDEPFAGLDRNSTERLAEILAELKSAGKTLLIAAHDDIMTDNLIDDIIHVDRG